MKRLSLVAVALFGSVLVVAGCSMIPGMDGGWTTLIDGTKGLENFNQIGDANWRAEDGAIVADKGKGGYLVSKNSYKDFQIRAEFWADTTTNSGIFLRAQDPKKIGADTAYEVNIFDQRPDPTFGTGAIVNVAKVSPMPKAGGKWNVMEITARGDTFTVVFNGQKTVDVTDKQLLDAGPIALQYGSGSLKWRKVQIRSL